MKPDQKHRPQARFSESDVAPPGDGLAPRAAWLIRLPTSLIIDSLDLRTLISGGWHCRTGITLVNLAFFVGAHIVVAPPHLPRFDSVDSRVAGGCSNCLKTCERVTASQRGTSSESTPHEPQRRSPDDSGCPVCRHVLIAGQVIPAAVTVADFGERTDANQCVVTIVCRPRSSEETPPVRGPPPSQRASFDTNPAQIGHRSPVRHSFTAMARRQHRP